MTPERRKRVQRFGLLAGVGGLVFLVAFYLSFPYERIKELVVAMAAQQNLDVEIQKAGPTLGLGISFSNISVKTRPLDGSKPTQLKIDDADVSLSPLSRLLGNDAFSISADALGGDVDVDVEQSKEKGHFKVKASAIEMKAIPGVRESINLPLAGALDLKLDIAQPQNRIAETSGGFEWKCVACAVGDGKEKFKVASNPLLAEGITFPKIRLGDFGGKIAFDKGVGRLQGVQAKSPDGEVRVDGEIRLSDPIRVSYADLYVMFKLSDALLKSNDKLQIIMQLAESMGKRPDGFYGFRVTGPIGQLSGVQWSKTSPFPAGGPAGRPGRASNGPGGLRAPAAGDDLVDPTKAPNANLPRFPTAN